MYTYIYIYMYTCISLYTYIHIYIYTYVHIYIYIYIHIHIKIYISAHMYTYTSASLYTYAYTYTYACRPLSIGCYALLFASSYAQCHGCPHSSFSAPVPLFFFLTHIFRMHNAMEAITTPSQRRS